MRKKIKIRIRNTQMMLLFILGSLSFAAAENYRRKPRSFDKFGTSIQSDNLVDTLPVLDFEWSLELYVKPNGFKQKGMVTHYLPSLPQLLLIIMDH